MTNDPHTPEPVRRMVESAPLGMGQSLEKYQRDWLTTHATTLYNDAYARGKVDGKLEEIEANAVSEITIAKDKVEQIRNDAEERGAQRERERIATKFRNWLAPVEIGKVYSTLTQSNKENTNK